MSQNISMKTSLETVTTTPEPTHETTLDTTPEGSTQESTDRTTAETTARPTARQMSGPAFVCPQEDIISTGCEGPKDCLYANPQNCHTFIECTVNSDGVSGTPQVMPCAAQLEWNDRKKECDYPEFSTCPDRSTPRPSTTHTPTDTTVTDKNTQGTTGTEEPTTTPEPTDERTLGSTEGSTQRSTEEPVDTTTPKSTDKPTTTEETSDGPTQGSTETPTDRTTGAEPTQGTTDDANQDIKQQPKFYARDSLDRFGDDLFGHLLSYLSLEDRFRLESVSKQFQRTVFGSVVEIWISDNLSANPLKTLILATIVTKCPNIRRVDCRGLTSSEELVSEVINAFGDNLPDIRYTFGPNSDQFLPIFGSRVIQLTIWDRPANQSLIHCHRLSHLQFNQLSEVFDTTSGQLLVNNIQAIDVPFDSGPDKQMFAAFISGNQSLKRIAVIIDRDLPEMLGQLSRLTQLKQLSLHLCLNDCHINGQTLNPLRYYKRLKRLELSLSSPIDHQLLEPLKLCHGLTHLTLYFNPINGKLFQNCDKNWPRLKCLTLGYIRYIGISQTDYMINSEFLVDILKLPALQMFVIHNCHPNYYLSDYDFTHLLSTSPKLKGIQFNGYDIYCRSFSN